MKRSRWLRAAAVREITVYSTVRCAIGAGEGKSYVVVFGRGFGDCDFLERVVDFAGLAVDFLDYDGGRHCGCGERRALGKLSGSCC
jgi:hypothetical protein